MRQPRGIEDWDRDSVYIRSLAKAEEIALEKDMAIQSALNSHPVTHYVKECPLEDVYEGSTWLHPAISESYLADGKKTTERFIEWGLPGRDAALSERMGCGFKTQDPDRMVFTACPDHAEHYIKAARIHCWRLSCPNCMNDVCMKRGAQIEKKVLAYADLQRRAGLRVPALKHWVFSPPQEWAKEVMRDADRYPELVKLVQLVMIDNGFLGGVMVFHPWRLQDDEWVLGPHFHIVGYGYVDNRRIAKRYDCVVKQVHPGERIRSVRQTIAYLMTHAGIGYAERNEDDIDFSMSILNHFIPGLANGDDTGFSEQDYEDMFTGRGRMNGELNIDWVEWTKRRYTRNFNAVRTFGVCGRRSIRNFDVYKETRTRRCPECGAVLMMYHGFGDHAPEPSRYIHESPIMVLASNYHLVMDVWQHYRADLEADGLGILDFAVKVPQLSTPQSMGLDDYDSEAAVSMRREARDRVIRYVPSKYGKGLDPVVMTREQARVYDRYDVVPDDVDHPDPIRTLSEDDIMLRSVSKGWDELRREISDGVYSGGDDENDSKVLETEFSEQGVA